MGDVDFFTVHTYGQERFTENKPEVPQVGLSTPLGRHTAQSLPPGKHRHVQIGW